MVAGGAPEGHHLHPRRVEHHRSRGGGSRAGGLPLRRHRGALLHRRDGYLGYGYMWWIFDGPRVTGALKGAYTGIGAVGQWITVIPAQNIVVAHKTNNIYGRSTATESWERILEFVLDAKGVKLPGSYPWAAK